MGKVARDETLKRVADAIEAIAINGAGSASNAQNWPAIRNLVRAGMGPKAYPVGTQLVVKKETSLSAAMGTHTGITAVSVTEETFLAKEGIVGTGLHEFKYDGAAWIYHGEPVNLMAYGISVTGTAADGDEIIVTEAFDNIVFEVAGYKTVNGSPRMVLVMRDVIYGRMFDQTEALVYVEEALAAGTYNIISDDATPVTYQFTLQNAVAAGSILVATWPSSGYDLTGQSIKVYANGSLGTVLETATISVGNDGTNLGTFALGNVNHKQRGHYGSNNYKESALRQWINSKAAANAWWRSTNKFDVVPGYANVAGLLHGMDADFLDCVALSTVPCKTNNTFELEGWSLNTQYTVEDKFYLLSRDEVGFGVENNAEGSVLELYNGATNADRIKYDLSAQTTARTWFLRSPYPGYAGSVRYVYTGGSLDYNSAYGGLGAVAACEIG